MRFEYDCDDCGKSNAIEVFDLMHGNCKCYSCGLQLSMNQENNNKKLLDFIEQLGSKINDLQNQIDYLEDKVDQIENETYK